MAQHPEGPDTRWAWLSVGPEEIWAHHMANAFLWAAGIENGAGYYSAVGRPPARRDLAAVHGIGGHAGRARDCRQYRAAHIPGAHSGRTCHARRIRLPGFGRSGQAQALRDLRRLRWRAPWHARRVTCHRCSRDHGASAWTDQAGQCRIVAAQGPGTLADYRRQPDRWSEVGLMNSAGKLVCLDAPRQVWDDMKADEPLAAGVTYRYD
jgi:hypothetical protein